MAGNPGAAAFVDVRSIGGLTNNVNRKLSQQVCKLLNDSLGVPENRVYLNFTEVEASNWGWNGSTFG
jgi:phenylpyruvate tautomerase PptA (4-oxalocrotonate tautomerase family)